jgi:hypothetical protein
MKRCHHPPDTLELAGGATDSRPAELATSSLNELQKHHTAQVETRTHAPENLRVAVEREGVVQQAKVDVGIEKQLQRDLDSLRIPRTNCDRKTPGPLAARRSPTIRSPTNTARNAS